MEITKENPTDQYVKHYADKYFEEKNLEDWSLRDFLGEDPNKRNNDQLLGSWHRVLERRAKDETNPAQMEKAKKLLLSYTKDKMSIFPDDTLDNGRIIFNQNGSHGTQTIQFCAEERKRKRPTKHKKEKAKLKRTNPSFLENFIKRYSSMGNSTKWHLPSGTCVEDVLFTKFKKYQVEHPAHSFIIDPDDDEVKECFGEEDFAHIRSYQPKLPESNKLFLDAFHRFAKVKTLSDLSNTLRTTSYFSKEDATIEYDLLRSKYPGPCWLDSEMRLILNLYHSNQLANNNLENWFTVHVWSALDRAMMSLDDVELSRGESHSTCSSDRKNSAPVTKPSRKKPSPRYDGLLRYNNMEIGAVEHGRFFESKIDRKWASDTLKLLKVLRDMLVRLQEHAPDNTEFRDLQVLGFITAKLCCQSMTMKYAEGSVTVLTKHPSQEFPKNINGIGRLFLLLMNLWSLRDIVECTKKTINGFTSVERVLQQPNSPNKQPKTNSLLWSIDTDEDTHSDTPP